MIYFATFMVRRICLFSEDMASFFRGITPKYIILTGCLFTLLFAFFPVLYLIAAIKVARSNQN